MLLPPLSTNHRQHFQAGQRAQAKAPGIPSTNSSTNFAAPASITAAAVTSTLGWTSFLGMSSGTGPNGDTAFAYYDANARPSSTVSPNGAGTGYVYNDTATPPTRVATTNGRWVKSTLDGFGRTVKMEAGDAVGTKSVVDTVYAPCACSPLGKRKQVSQPHLPGGT